MFRFIETIRIEGGIPRNLAMHQQRMQATFERFFPDAPFPSLQQHLDKKQLRLSEILKCKILYNRRILKTEFSAYKAKEIITFRLITTNDLSYDYKFSNRRALNRGKKIGEELIFVKNGLITDTSFTNIAVCISGKWYTPAQPLLKGTMRAALLRSGHVKEKEISEQEFLGCEKFRLINAMLPLDESKDYYPSLIL